MSQFQSKKSQQKLALEFRQLHNNPKPLILPNAWDCCSAKIFEEEGFKALGTTSAGIAASIGYPDGQKITFKQNLDIVKGIARNISIPLSVDFEAGYSNNLDEIVKNVNQLIDIAVVGINIEDCTGMIESPLLDIGYQREKIEAIREAARSREIELWINARTDAWMSLVDSKQEKIAKCIDRAETYLVAGADSIFIPDLEDLDEKTISVFVREIDAPLNLIAGSNTSSIAELSRLGVKRVSLGPRPMRAMLSTLKNIANEIINDGTYSLLSESKLTYQSINQWFTND